MIGIKEITIEEVLQFNKKYPVGSKIQFKSLLSFGCGNIKKAANSDGMIILDSGRKINIKDVIR